MLQGRRLSELVEAKLAAMIREGEVEVGDSLPSERALMSLFGVGRPSIREALFALQRKGLVRLRRGGAPLVSRPQPQTLLRELSDVALELVDQPEGVRHFDQARTFLESSIARFAAETADAAAVDRLEAVLAANERAIGQPSRFVRTDVAFHRELTLLTANPMLLAMHDAMVEWVISRRPPVHEPLRHNRISFEGHRAVVDAIAARQPEAAFEAMRRHLEDVARMYRN